MGHTCEECGRQFKTVQGLSVHEPVHEPSGVEIGEDSLTESPGYEANADAYVYVLTVRRKVDDELFYYVGKTSAGENALVDRLKSHKRKMKQMAKPLIVEGEQRMVTGTDGLELTGIECVESYDDIAERRLLDREREKSYEVAIEKSTTNVIGGH